jgi:hypothetical protein
VTRNANGPALERDERADGAFVWVHDPFNFQ